MFRPAMIPSLRRSRSVQRPFTKLGKSADSGLMLSDSVSPRAMTRPTPCRPVPPGCWLPSHLRGNSVRWTVGSARIAPVCSTSCAKAIRRGLEARPPVSIAEGRAAHYGADRRAGGGFRSLTENIDTTTAAGRMMMQMVGAFAEFERAMIRERTSAGLVAARAEAASAGGGRSWMLRSAARSPTASSPAVRPAPRWRGSTISAGRPCHASSLRNAAASARPGERQWPSIPTKSTRQCWHCSN